MRRRGKKKVWDAREGDTSRTQGGRGFLFASRSRHGPSLAVWLFVRAIHMAFLVLGGVIDDRRSVLRSLVHEKRC